MLRRSMVLSAIVMGSKRNFDLSFAIELPIYLASALQRSRIGVKLIEILCTL